MVHINQSINQYLKKKKMDRNTVVTGGVTVDISKVKDKRTLGFPGGAVVENLPASAGDTGSNPSLGRSHMPRSN